MFVPSLGIERARNEIVNGGSLHREYDAERQSDRAESAERGAYGARVSSRCRCYYAPTLAPAARQPAHALGGGPTCLAALCCRSANNPVGSDSSMSVAIRRSPSAETKTPPRGRGPVAPGADQCSLRRREKPRPASAIPRSARVAGSGTPGVISRPIFVTTAVPKSSKEAAWKSWAFAPPITLLL